MQDYGYGWVICFSSDPMKLTTIGTNPVPFFCESLTILSELKVGSIVSHMLSLHIHLLLIDPNISGSCPR